MIEINEEDEVKTIDLMNVLFSRAYKNLIVYSLKILEDKNWSSRCVEIDNNFNKIATKYTMGEIIIFLSFKTGKTVFDVLGNDKSRRLFINESIKMNNPKSRGIE